MRSRFFSSLVAVLLVSVTFAADTAEEAFKRASSALQLKDYLSAEKGFLAVLGLEPRNVGALGNLGVVYTRTQRYAKAIDSYQKALKIVPGEKTLLTNLGLAYIKQEQFSAALPIFQTLSRDTSNLQAQELLATCYLSGAAYSRALEVLTSLQSMEPENPGVLYMSGVALTRLKRKDEAHAAFTRMMSAVTPAQANFLMGKASYETGDFAQAADFFRKALEVDPAFDGAHRELGKTLISLHQDEAAAKELRLAKPDDPEAMYFLGAAIVQSEPKEAVRLLNRARQLSPDFWAPPYYLGKIAVEQGRTAEAISLLEQAAELKPGEPAVHYQLAKAFQLSGRKEKAAAEFALVKQLKEQALTKEVNVLSPNAKQPN